MFVVSIEMLLVASFLVNAYVLYEQSRVMKMVRKLQSVNQLILFALEELADGKVVIEMNDEEEEENE